MTNQKPNVILLIDKISHIFSSSLLRKQVMTLFSGSALAQALPLIAFPFITRMYSKEDIAYFFIFVAAGMITQICSSFQYYWAIVLPKEDKEANQLLMFNHTLSVLTAIILYGLIVAIGEPLCALFDQPDFYEYMPLLALSTFFLGLFNNYSYYFNRFSKYGYISIAKVIRTVTYVSIQLVMGYFGYLKWGLILGLLVGQALSTLYLTFCLLTSKYFSFDKVFDGWKELAIRYKDIPVFNTSTMLANTLSNQLPIFLLPKYYSTAVTSDFGLANRSVQTPFGILSQAIGEVFFREASERNNKGEALWPLVKSFYKKLALIAIVPTLVLAWIAPELFSFLFGPEYYQSGVMSQWIMPWVFFSFISVPISGIFTILNRQRMMLVLNIITLLIRWIVLYLAYYLQQDALLAIKYYALIGVLYSLFQLWYFQKISRKPHTYAV